MSTDEGFGTNLSEDDKQKMLLLLKNPSFKAFIEHERKQSLKQDDDKDEGVIYAQSHDEFDKLLSTTERNMLRKMSGKIGEIIEDYEMAEMLGY